MKNPLNKRIIREFKSDFGKYAVIFLLLVGTIGFISGFLVAGSSMKTALDNSFEDYNIENGHFTTYIELDDETIEYIEKSDVKIYKDFYYDLLMSDDEKTLRIYKNREEVNKVCLMNGEMPDSGEKIALDRMFAENNDIKIGNQITVAGQIFTVSGYVALSDYTALFSDNKDTMFDSLLFGVAIVDEEGYTRLEGEKCVYNYEFKYTDEPDDEKDEMEIAQNLALTINERAMLDSFVPRYASQAINFAGDDLGKDKSMMLVLLYILMAIMAFVFAVTINHTIVKEATTIGTLRASGYTKGELLRHYIAMPVIITIIAAVIGNILGYTVFKNVIADMYYGSYSLPTYVTIWNGEAFVLTTVLPVMIMIVINILVISRKLSLSPLKFIRRDFSGNKRKKAVKLPKFSFFNRFRLRVILQNIPNYITLFVGLLFANILLMFGLMMSPILDNYKDEVLESMPCSYQYVLVAPIEVNNKDAEKFGVTSLVYTDDGRKEEISIIGGNDNSKYISDKLPDNSEGVSISDGFAQKFGIKVGDKISLSEEYGDETYELKVSKIVGYPSSLSVFMSLDSFNKMFDRTSDYFNGYFSNEKLDIDEHLLAKCITKDDMTKVSRQLEASMGEMFILICVFAIILFIILVYLLTKLILEKNTLPISMVKILGYSNAEISSLYIVSTSIVVVVSVAITTFLSEMIIKYLYILIMKDMTGWLTYYIAPKVYVEMVVLGILAYLVVAFLQYRKIKKIPMSEALKNLE